MEYQNKILIITSIIIFIFLLSFQTINAQTNSKHDSLLSELNKTNVDTSKVRFLIELSLVLQETDTSKSIKYLQKAIQISEKVNFKLGKAKALYFLGVLYYKHENYLLALDNFYKSQNLLPELNENNLYVDCLNLIGATFMNLDNYTKAKEYNQKAFNLANENNDKKRQAKSIYGIGLAYYHTADYSEARFYYQKALKIFIEINDKKGTSMCLNCIGSVNVRQKNYDLSIEYYRKSLKISKEINNQKWI